MLYPFLLSKQQRKGVASGVSFFAISQLLLAAGVIYLWGRSAIKSFDRVTADNFIPTLSMPTFSQEELNNRVLTPTATPWVVLGAMGETEGELNNDMQVIAPTQTPWVITATPAPTPTITPTAWYANLYIPLVPGIATNPNRTYDELQYAKLSYYYPPYAYEDIAYEINCDKVNGVLECEHMASGQLTADYIGEAVACPVEYPFGTVFEIMGGFYTCRDRGGAIVRIDEQTIWLDILYPYMPNGAYWGQEEVVKVYLPVVDKNN